MKNGGVIGLLISATGSALFRPAATLLSYPLFLGGLFIVGLGFAMLQIAANPYVTTLGPERTASSRLNLAQAFNSVWLHPVWCWHPRGCRARLEL